jgi:hypothetical protein
LVVAIRCDYGFQQTLNPLRLSGPSVCQKVLFAFVRVHYSSIKPGSICRVLLGSFTNDIEFSAELLGTSITCYGHKCTNGTLATLSAMEKCSFSHANHYFSLSGPYHCSFDSPSKYSVCSESLIYSLSPTVACVNLYLGTNCARVLVVQRAMFNCPIIFHHHVYITIHNKLSPWRKRSK